MVGHLCVVFVLSVVPGVSGSTLTRALGGGELLGAGLIGAIVPVARWNRVWPTALAMVILRAGDYPAGDPPRADDSVKIGSMETHHFIASIGHPPRQPSTGEH